MATAYRYVVADVFTDRPLTGNPLAVFTDGRGLDDETMQRVARELNLSETVFVLPAEKGGTARIRIFTPLQELPFAGHPTLGSCHAWLEAGGKARDPRRIVQQCAAKLNQQSQSRPSVSGNPRTRFRFCTACPAAPFTRLSMQLTTTPRRVAWSYFTPMSQKLVRCTAAMSGMTPGS